MIISYARAAPRIYEAPEDRVISSPKAVEAYPASGKRTLRTWYHGYFISSTQKRRRTYREQTCFTITIVITPTPTNAPNDKVAEVKIQTSMLGIAYSTTHTHHGCNQPTTLPTHHQHFELRAEPSAAGTSSPDANADIEKIYADRPEFQVHALSTLQTTQLQFVS